MAHHAHHQPELEVDEPVDGLVFRGGADVGASREAAAHASALVGCAVECEFKPRMAPTRAENLYA